MNGVTAIFLRNGNDLFDIEVGRGTPIAQPVREVGIAEMAGGTSCSLQIATVSIPRSAAVRAIRTAISPRLAINNLRKSGIFGAVADSSGKFDMLTCPL